MKRQILQKMVDWKNKPTRLPLILKGARQVGKTYILKEFGKAYPACHYINFEADTNYSKLFQKNLIPKKILDDLSLYLNVEIKPEHLIIFDEIQNCPNALTSLKYFAEEMPHLHICSAGSLLGINLNKTSFPVGKVEFLEMYPMTFFEFLNGIEEKKLYDFLINVQLENEAISEPIHQKIWDLLKIYFICGGLPSVILEYIKNKENTFIAFSDVRKKQEDLITAYIADMAKHSGKINSMNIEKTWKSTAHQLSKEHDGSAPKFRFSDVINGSSRFSTLESSIEWLKTAGLILKVPIINSANQPLSAYIKENLIKLYIFDIGILGAISDLKPRTIMEYDYGSYKGYFAENYIIQELQANNHKAYNWREKTAEVEFLIETNTSVIPIEVKSGWVTHAKSLKVFCDKYKPKQNYTFSAKNIEIINSDYKLPLYLVNKW